MQKINSISFSIVIMYLGMSNVEIQKLTQKYL